MRILHGSKIISNNKAQTTYANDPNVQGIKGDEVSLGGHVKQIGSVVSIRAAAGALLGFINIASIGGTERKGIDLWYPPPQSLPGQQGLDDYVECEHLEMHPDDLCIQCIEGRWTHKDLIEGCGHYAERFNPARPMGKGIFGGWECGLVKDMSCEVCGPCDECRPISDISETYGAYCYDKTDDYAAACQDCDYGADCDNPDGPVSICGECQKCDGNGTCVDDPDGTDSEGNPCYDASSLNIDLMP